MKLAYQDLAVRAQGTPALVLHRERTTSVDGPAGVAMSTAGVGRVVAPYGDYASYPSGMEVGGLCWYRHLPGFAGTDPISLTKAVVQVCDLLDDLELAEPLLIGWGQGGVVAVGAGFLRAADVASVVCVDAPPGHLELLPARVLTAGARPPILLAATDRSTAAAIEQQAGVLGGRGPRPTIWSASGGGTAEERDKALSERVGAWLENGPDRSPGR